MPCALNNADSRAFRYPYNSLLGLLAHQRYLGPGEYDRPASHSPIFPAARRNRTSLHSQDESSDESSERSSSVSEILQEALEIVDRSQHSMGDQNRIFPTNRSQDGKSDDSGPPRPHMTTNISNGFALIESQANGFSQSSLEDF